MRKTIKNVFVAKEFSPLSVAAGEEEPFDLVKKQSDKEECTVDEELSWENV